MAQKIISKTIYSSNHDHNEGDYLAKPRRGGKIAIIRLIFKYYYKSIYGPVFNFAFPVILYLVLSVFMPSSFVIPGMISMTTMSLGVVGLPYSVLELKNSVILKRIGAAPVKKRDFTIAVVIFFIIQLLLSIVCLMLVTLLRELNPHLFDGMNNWKSALGFIYGNFLNALLAISLGFLIASFSKSPNQANAISALIFFPASFLAGQFISIDVIASKPIMNYISWIIPFRYTTMIITVSFAGPNVFEGSPFLYNDLSVIDIGQLNRLVQEILTRKLKTIEDLQTMKALEILELGAAEGIIFQFPDGKLLDDNFNLIFGRKVLYHAWEVIMAYVYPYTIIVSSLVTAIETFSWSSRR